ncbi:MAG: hemerythrin [Psychromonas sp.]|jgi:hemerythrin|uniref:bacteriohemerythrin n=1 Tax=Psychromonas sp. TaxID=1884585 RepID=UPI0039E24294
MHIYKWQDKYDVGIDAIDVEHRNLLTCINKLITAQTLDRSIILKLADEVSLYAEFHFLSEENLMCLTHYPDLTKHSECHRVLLKQLAVKRRNLEESANGLQDYVNFLVKWFIEHTQTIDKELGQYVKKYEPTPNSPEHIIQQLSMGKNMTS